MLLPPKQVHNVVFLLPLIVVNHVFPDLKRSTLFSQIIIAIIVFRADIIQSMILDTVTDLFESPRII